MKNGRALINVATDDRNLLKECTIITFLWGLLTHGYMFLNNSIAHDSLNEFITNAVVVTRKIQAGSIFVPIYEEIMRGMITLPWLVGLLSLLYISIAVFLIVKIFNIESRVMNCLISGILTTNTTVIALAATYINDMDCDILAMLLAVLSVYFWNKSKKGFLYGIIPLAVSMGLYQSYLSTAITLIMIVSIMNFLTNEKCVDVLVTGLKGVAMIIGAGLVYLCALKVTYAITGITMSSGNYNSMDTILSMSFSGILTAIYETYKFTISTILQPVSMYPSKITLFLHLLMVSLMMISIINKLIRNKISLEAKVFILLLLFFLPIGMNVSRILTNNYSHDLMHFALWLVYIFALILVSESKSEKPSLGKIKIDRNNVLKYISVCLIFVILWGNVRTANTAYLVRDFDQDASLALLTRVVYEIENYDGYVTGKTKLALIGKPNGLLESTSEYSAIRKMTGMKFNYVLSTTSSGYYQAYFKYVLMNPAAIASNDIISSLKKNEIVKNMPLYPADGSISMVDDILVVKLGKI